MVGKIGVHYEDEVPRGVLDAVKVSSSYRRSPEVVTYVTTVSSV